MKEMAMEDRDSFLKDEYLLLQNQYEDFDRRSLIIKGWSVTLALGGVGLGFQYDSTALWFLAALAGLLFWTLEAMWKFFQYCLSPRIQEIEGYFRGESDPMPPFQSYGKWFETFSESRAWHKEILANMALAPVLIPHAPAVGVAVLLLLIHYIAPGVLTGNETI